jgi:choline-sulfatase
VPLIINYPDGWKKGTKVKQHVSLIDIAPTILDMAGVRKEDILPMDGKSLLGLIDGSDREERTVFSELHTEGVYSTCFMIRRGRYKYIYIHGKGAQLFDLEKDCGEWNNLSGKPEYREVENELKEKILEQFNPDEIEKEVSASLLRRRLIKKAMKINNTHWDYQPYFDAAKQYWREG